MFRPITNSIKSNFVFTLSSILGIFPFKVIKNQFMVDKPLIVYSTVLSSFVSIANVYFIFVVLYDMKSEMDHHGKAFNHFLTFCTSLLQSFLFLLFSVCFYFQRNGLLETVHSLDTLEVIFKRHLGNFSKRTIEKGITFKILCPPLLCGIVAYFGGNTNDDITVASALTLNILGKTLCCEQVIFFVGIVSDYIQSCSEFVSRMKRTNFIPNLPSLEKLVEAISRLVSVTEKINAVYSQQLLVIIFISQCAIISHLYYLYIYFTSHEGWRHPCIPGDSMVVLCHLCIVWRLNHSADVAYNELKKFDTLLYRLMIKCKNNKITYNGKLMLHIWMKREVVFTVCGLFNLDYTLIYSMVTTATTYLFILIQFTDTEDENRKQTAVAEFTTLSSLPLSTSTELSTPTDLW